MYSGNAASFARTSLVADRSATNDRNGTVPASAISEQSLPAPARPPAEVERGDQQDHVQPAVRDPGPHHDRLVAARCTSAAVRRRPARSAGSRRGRPSPGSEARRRARGEPTSRSGAPRTSRRTWSPPPPARDPGSDPRVAGDPGRQDDSEAGEQPPLQGVRTVAKSARRGGEIQRNGLQSLLLRVAGAETDVTLDQLPGHAGRAAGSGSTSPAIVGVLRRQQDPGLLDPPGRRRRRIALGHATNDHEQPAVVQAQTGQRPADRARPPARYGTCRDGSYVPENVTERP